MNNQQHAMSSPRKFRVWDGEELHLPPHDWQLTSQGNLQHKGAFYGVHGRPPVPLFYTGLTDAEGAEIYEGDVIRCSLKGGEKADFVVGWDQILGCWSATPRIFEAKTERSASDLWEMLDKDAVVFGNKHENPDLLKEPA